MFDQMSSYIDKYSSPFLCGFRKGFSTQHCRTSMLDRWKNAIDSGKLAGALLTDLSKAFDCLNLELLFAKLDVYGFDQLSLTYIYRYLSHGKQRTEVNNSFSEWCNISYGVPHGSKCNITNYADDTTPYSEDTTIHALLNSLETDTDTLIQWSSGNYLQLNADKCHLLISKCNKDIFINVQAEVIECSSSVKRLGVIIDNNLKFNEHVSNLCQKANQK